MTVTVDSIIFISPKSWFKQVEKEKDEAGREESTAASHQTLTFIFTPTRLIRLFLCCACKSDQLEEKGQELSFVFILTWNRAAAASSVWLLMKLSDGDMRKCLVKQQAVSNNMKTPSIIKNKRALKKKRPYIEPCGTPLELSRINGSPLSLEQYFLCSQADCIKCLFHVCKHNSYNPSFTTTDFLFGSFKNWPEAEEELDFWTRSSCKLTNCKEAWSLFPSLNADINYEVAGWNVRFSDQYEERRNRFNLPINTV